MAYIHNIKNYDMENTLNQGAAVSIWFNQCPHKCIGCWNPETWERQADLFIDNKKVAEEILNYLNGEMELKTLSLLGGDPLSPKNISDTIEILEIIKKEKPNLQVICWTGFTIRQVMGSKLLKPSLKYIDVLIDGRFEIDKKVVGKIYGSSNQKRIFIQDEDPNITIETEVGDIWVKRKELNFNE